MSVKPGDLESRPLLNEDAGCLDSEAHLELVTVELPSKFPKCQFGILCFLRTLDPMSFTQIFPYVNEFVNDLHVTTDPAQIGFYSGLMESSFAFFQLLAIYPWGLLSDRFGRRPVVLTGIGGLAIATLSFGFSTSFAMAIAFRGLAGLFSGNVTVIPSMVCEITTEKTQAFAYSFFGVWWPLGAIVGPLIGGLFSKPAPRYPELFDYQLFRTYPYALPGIMMSLFTSLAFIVSYFFLKETLIIDRKETQTGTMRRCYGTTTMAHRNVHESYNVKELLEIPIIRALCVSGFAISFMSTGFEVLFVLFCYSPISAGGLGFPASKIGFAMSIAGVVAAILHGVFMPTILSRVDHASMYHHCMRLWPLAFILMPLLNKIAKYGLIGTQQLDHFTGMFLWISIAVILCLARIAHLPYTISVLLVKRYVPNKSSLGSTIALVQFFICLSRAFSPIISSFMFAFSIKSGLFSGYLWVIFMTFIGLMSLSSSKILVKESAKLS